MAKINSNGANTITSCLTEDKQEVQRVHQDGMAKINSNGANTIMYRSINIAVIS
jgi:hypothetical protein